MNIMKKNRRTVCVFVLPALLVFTAFGLAPLLPPVFYSLFQYKELKLGGFTGLDNYLEVLRDPAFGVVLRNNLKLLALQFLIGAPLSFLSAVLISAQGPRVRRFFKTASFIPAVLSVSVVCMMWSMLLQPQLGAVQPLMEALGLGKWFKPWLSQPETAFNVVIFTVIWQAVGYNMVLLYAGIKAIPASYFEAARLDGASMFQQVRYLTLPLMQETIKFVAILMVTGTLAMIAQVQILMNGAGVGEAAYSTVYYIYVKAFREMNYGYAYALTVIYACISFAVVLVLNRLIGRKRLEYI